MYPENSMKSRKKPLIILIAVIIMLAIVVLSLTAASSKNSGNSGGPKGTLEISYNMPDTNGVTVKLNDKTQKTSTKYSLTPGKYTIKITRPGYKPFTTSVNVQENGDVLVNVHADPIQPTPVDTSTQLTPLLPDTLTNARVTSTEYFNDKTWAVVRFNTDQEDGDVAVLHFIPEVNKWVVIGDPGTIIDPNQVTDAPAQVLSYLQDNSLIYSGD